MITFFLVFYICNFIININKGLITQWLECTPDKREVGSSSLPKPTL
jgi:hypothetical protein